MNRHLSHDELLSRFYGLGPKLGAENVKEDDPQKQHLRVCVDCAERLAAFERNRAASAALPAVSKEFLAGQRRRIYARLEEAPRMSLRWAPALAAMFLLTVGLMWQIPRLAQSPPATSGGPGVAVEATDEEQVLRDIYSMEQSLEPRAGAPIHALFEQSVFEKTAVEGEQ